MKTEFKILDRKILKNGHTIDQSLLWVVVLMTAFSLIMIYSSSIAYAIHDGGYKWFYLERQAIFIGLGVIVGLIAFRIPMSKWQRHSGKILFLAILLLCGVLLFGREINGAKRWIHLGPVNLQATEFFKLAIILYISGFLIRRAEVLKQLNRVLWVSVPLGFGLGLIMLEPDFGSFVVILCISLALLFLAGLPWKWFLTALVACLVMIVLMIFIAPYRVARMTTFLDPWKDPLGKGYQLTHSLMAVSRGEWFGAGLGMSIEKRFYLPEAHTDFLLAVVAEELGLIGIFILIFCYVWLLLRAFSIGVQASKLDLHFNSLVAKGIGMWIGIQGIFSIGVNIGVLPTKGLTLPLMSYGGSSVIVMLVSIAFLLRVDYENRRKMCGYRVEESR